MVWVSRELINLIELQLLEGGSDTTAVALAASLNALRCDIYTDDGVFSADPKIVKEAKKMRNKHEEMLELSSLGAKVLSRSVC